MTKYARRASLFLFLLLTANFSGGAQEFNSVAFDPLPVEIPSFEKGEPRPVTSMDLLRIRDEKGVSISPDGKYVAFVVGQAVYETNSYRSGLYIVGTAPGSTPVCLGTAGAPRWDVINQWLSDPPQWSPDSKHITRVAKMNIAAKWQIWRWNVNGGTPLQLTDVPGDVQTYHWTLQGDKIVVTFEKPRDTVQIQRLTEDGILYDGGFIPSRNRPVVSEVLASRRQERETWIHDVTSGEERKQTITDTESVGLWVSDIGEQYYDGTTSFAGHHLLDAKVAPDGHRVAYRVIDDSPGRKGYYQLLSKPVRGGTPVELAPGVYFISDYWWAADSSRIYFTQYAGDGRPDKLMVVPAEGGTPKQAFSSPDSLYSCFPDKNFQYMACASESKNAPAQIALVDIASGTVRTLVDLNPEFANLELGSITRLDGVNTYGDRWRADLVKPLNYQAGKKYPLIVTTYRTHEFLRGASGNENPIHVYAAHGFAVLSFDFGLRDYDNEPGDFHRFLSWYESVQASIEMAVQKASELGIADTARVGLAGYSRGTEIVAYAITHSKLSRAVSGAAGDNGPCFYYLASRRAQEYFSREGLGWPEGKSKANWRQLGSDLNAENIDVPVLNNDPDSEFLADLPLYTSLRELGKPVELFIYPDELHVVNQPKHRYEIYERNLDWFRFWLKSEESDDSGKSEQYQRWHQLRQLQQKAQSNEQPIPARQH